MNVEAQQRNPSSFLHWMRRMLQARKPIPRVRDRCLRAWSPCANPSVLAYVRSPQPEPGQAPRPRRSGRGRRGGGRNDAGVDNPVLCVHNLSRFAQPAELDLVRWAGRNPVELLGRVPFPPVWHVDLPA